MFEKSMVLLDENEIGFQERIDLLLNGGCQGIFPISIIKDDEGVKGFYSTAGYKQLAKMDCVSAGEILTVVEKTIEALEECRQYLIFADEFCISTETAYMDKNFQRIKFTYIPSEAKKNFSQKMVIFLGELKDITTKNGRIYLEMLEEFLSIDNLNMIKFKAFLLQLKREINLCNIV